MASFFFDKYVKFAGGVGTESGIPLTKNSRIGFVLVSAVPKQEDTFADMTFCVDQSQEGNPAAFVKFNDLPNPLTFVMTSSGPEDPSDEDSERIKGYASVKSNAISFGKNPQNTYIVGAMGAVLYVQQGALETAPTDSDSTPVCFVDFGDAVEAKNGPFKVVFNGGDVTTEPETPGTIFKLK